MKCNESSGMEDMLTGTRMNCLEWKTLNNLILSKLEEDRKDGDQEQQIAV